jgi:hypothetical protein
VIVRLGRSLLVLAALATDNLAVKVSYWVSIQ